MAVDTQNKKFSFLGAFFIPGLIMTPVPEGNPLDAPDQAQLLGLYRMSLSAPPVQLSIVRISDVAFCIDFTTAVSASVVAYALSASYFLYMTRQTLRWHFSNPTTLSVGGNARIDIKGDAPPFTWAIIGAAAGNEKTTIDYPKTKATWNIVRSDPDASIDPIIEVVDARQNRITRTLTLL